MTFTFMMIQMADFQNILWIKSETKQNNSKSSFRNSCKIKSTCERDVARNCHTVHHCGYSQCFGERKNRWRKTDSSRRSSTILYDCNLCDCTAEAAPKQSCNLPAVDCDENNREKSHYKLSVKSANRETVYTVRLIKLLRVPFSHHWQRCHSGALTTKLDFSGKSVANMATFNTSHHQSGGVVLFSGELILLFCDNVNVTLPQTSQEVSG